MHEIIFWRHAQAGWGMGDLDRELTALGTRQAQATADWLRREQADFPIVCSEAIRGQQTAACYAPAQVLPGLNPGTPFTTVLKTVRAIAESRVIVVGHLPWIGQIVGEYLDLEAGYVAADYSEAFWLQSADGRQWQLAARFPAHGR